MGTVNKQFADRIVAGNGYVDGDDNNELGDNPRCVTITECITPEDAFAYGLTFEGQQNRYARSSEFVRGPKIYWEYKA